MNDTALLKVEASALTSAEPSDRLLTLDRLRFRVEAALLTTIAAWEACAVWIADGAGAGGVAHRSEQSEAAIGRLVDVASRLRHIRTTSQALASGRLSPAKADLLVSAAVGERRIQPISRDETALVSAVSELSADGAALEAEPIGEDSNQARWGCAAKLHGSGATRATYPLEL